MREIRDAEYSSFRERTDIFLFRYCPMKGDLYNRYTKVYYSPKGTVLDLGERSDLFGGPR